MHCSVLLTFVCVPVAPGTNTGVPIIGLTVLNCLAEWTQLVNIFAVIVLVALVDHGSELILRSDVVGKLCLLFFDLAVGVQEDTIGLIKFSSRIIGLFTNNFQK